MKISPIRNNIICHKRLNYTNNCHQNLNMTNFTGIFSKKPKQTDEYELGIKDQVMTLKIASVLPELDNKSVLVLSNQSEFSTFTINKCFSGDIDVLPDIYLPERFYHIKIDSSQPIVIAKNPKYSKDGFKIFGATRNLTARRNTEPEFIYLFARYGDTIQTYNGGRFRLLDIKTGNEDILSKQYTQDEWESLNKKPEKAKLDKKSKYEIRLPQRTFQDVAGLDDAIEKLKKNIMYPILYPFAYSDNLNHGTILQGPPGTGKTLLALSLIGELKQKGKNIHMLNIDPNSLERAYVGETQKLWRDVFDELRNNQPSVLFIDEVDKLFAERGQGENYLHRNDVLNQFLTLMDEIEKLNSQIYIIGATNRPDILDSAITRSGRFGNIINITLPDENSCLDILNLYLRDKKVDDIFDRKTFARKLYQKHRSGADIAEIVSKAKENMYERYQIYEKMDAGTLTQEDMEGLVLTEIDLNKAANY